jgi:hypothetical protein
MTRISKRIGWTGIVALSCVTTFGATALADEDAKKGKCGGGAEARFKKADTNGDGVLTAAEVGEKKWARIKVADSNADAKVSLAELKQAKADGKLGHGKKGKKGKKGKDGNEA